MALKVFGARLIACRPSRVFRWKKLFFPIEPVSFYNSSIMAISQLEGHCEENERYTVASAVWRATLHYAASMYVIQGADIVSGHAFLHFLNNVGAFSSAKDILQVATIQIYSCHFCTRQTLMTTLTFSCFILPSPTLQHPRPWQHGLRYPFCMKFNELQSRPGCGGEERKPS